VKGLKSLKVTTPEPLVVEPTVMFENVTGPTLHEKPAASYTLTEAVAHAAAKADDAPSNGDIPKSGPAASAAKGDITLTRHERLAGYGVRHDPASCQLQTPPFPG
jgi:hypothetical protein